jgi:hypothetical protein
MPAIMRCGRREEDGDNGDKGFAELPQEQLDQVCMAINLLLIPPTH